MLGTMKVQAKAPCRVDLAGGTLDIWPLYLYHANAVTVNFAVDLYTSCQITPHEGPSITLRSTDQNLEETYENLFTLVEAKKHRHPLAAWVVKYFRPTTGMTVETHSEAPSGGGISGSSSMLISTVSAFNRLQKTGLPIEKIRELAQNIEAQIINVPTGCQDYYPAMYGAVSAIELTAAGIQRYAIPVDVDELNSRFVLAYTGKPRNSGVNNWEVTKAHTDGDKAVRRNFDRIAAIAHAMRGALEQSDWKEAGRLLREEWSFRRKNAPGITTDLIDRLMLVTKKAGAIAGKACGAGGGGCVVFLCEPEAKARVREAIVAEGAQVLEASVAPKGVQIRVEK
jgi:D-glycero-alpha-D-manno-heptose-7-phosphate kinase